MTSHGAGDVTGTTTLRHATSQSFQNKELPIFLIESRRLSNLYKVGAALYLCQLASEI